MKNTKQFLLIAVGLGQVKQIYGPNPITLVQAEKKRLKNQTQWKAYDLQVRTVEGFKNVKVLPKKK